jgi:hypothetical protein
MARLCRLLPLCVNTNNTAQSTSKTDNAIVEEADPAETGDGDQDIAEIAEKLLLGGGTLTASTTVSKFDGKTGERR